MCPELQRLRSKELNLPHWTAPQKRTAQFLALEQGGSCHRCTQVLATLTTYDAFNKLSHDSEDLGDDPGDTWRQSLREVCCEQQSILRRFSDIPVHLMRRQGCIAKPRNRGGKKKIRPSP